LPWGRAPNVGELFQFKAAARGLRSIATSNGESFYKGDIAEALVAFSQAQGGAMTMADLASFTPEWVTPISQEYGGYQLHEIPPNGQGIAALMALGILKNFDLASLAVDSAASQHLQIEAMKLAFADIYQYVAEPSAMRVSSQQLLDSAYLRGRAKLIDLSRAQNFGAGNPVRGGTIYLTTADEDGMMVSFIQSNYMGFGSGCVEPNFGISLQNRGHGFNLNPESENCVAPRKRPFHTIIPAFLTKDVNGVTEPVMSFGVMGANMQPQGHIQTLIRMLDYGQNPQAACDAPRWRYNAGLEINVESGMPAATVQGLQDLGHQMAVINDSYQDFGAGQFIWRMGDPKIEGYQVASDPRRDGQAVGF
jgi:gamma-glutamyltranspeptidase/glutathione hydrolase